VNPWKSKENDIFTIYSDRVNILIPKGRNSRISKKDQTKAWTETKWSKHLIPYLHIQHQSIQEAGHRFPRAGQTQPCGLPGCKPHSLSLGLAPLIVCSLSWQMLHISGISNILGSPLQCKLQHHNLIHYLFRSFFTGNLTHVTLSHFVWLPRLSFEIWVETSIIL
jgi:hypothetical protein